MTQFVTLGMGSNTVMARIDEDDDTVETALKSVLESVNNATSPEDQHRRLQKGLEPYDVTFIVDERVEELYP